jgi:hypothetical protein
VKAVEQKAKKVVSRAEKKAARAVRKLQAFVGVGSGRDEDDEEDGNNSFTSNDGTDDDGSGHDVASHDAVWPLPGTYVCLCTCVYVCV